MKLKMKFFGKNTPWVPPPPTGSGYFGTSQTYLRVYDFANDTVALSIGTLPSQTNGEVSAANSVRGLFIRANNTNNTSRYEWANNATSAGPNVSAVMSLSGGWSMSNDTIALIGVGTGSGNSSVVNTYTYADNTMASAAAQATSASTIEGTALGNIDVGLVILNNATTTTNRYTFASQTRVAGPAMSFGSTTSSSTTIGNASFGIFVRNSSVTTSRYNYAANTSVSAPSAPTSMNGRQGASDGTNGVLPVSNGSTYKYSFTSETFTAPGASLVDNGVKGGVSSLNPGVNVSI